LTHGFNFLSVANKNGKVYRLFDCAGDELCVRPDENGALTIEKKTRVKVSVCLACVEALRD
jgi:hypothetical protein